MLARFFAPVALLSALASPAAADGIVGFSASASAGFGFSANVGVSVGVGVTPVAVQPAPVAVPVATPVAVPVPQPAPVYVHPAQTYVQPAPAYVQPAPVYVQPTQVYVQPTTVYVQPAPVYVQPATIVVQPVAPPPPPQVIVRAVPVVPQPVVVASGASVALTEEAPVEDDIVDLVAFGRYRNAFETGDTGGMSFALRLLLGSELSLETKFAYGAGGTHAGGNFEDAPLDFSLVWYPWQRDFPIYFAFGGGFAWSSVWEESNGVGDPTFGWGQSQDVWYVGTRTAVGLEFEVWDFLLLAAEAEFFYRWNVDEYGPEGGPGVSVDLGLGVRI
ncbi:MAG: hypothetical protein HY905_12955 [Deltaproteobacteria bacterium]|nr:hypothetical protein [Deltaproteobacteria bacterium]